MLQTMVIAQMIIIIIIIINANVYILQRSGTSWKFVGGRYRAQVAA